MEESMPSKYLKTHKAEYTAWIEMRRRCRAENRASRRHYRDAGIVVCERWSVFENFLSDMGRRPEGRYSVEREDNTKGYSPDNCKWATYAEQNANRSLCVMVDVGGDKLCLSEACRKLSVDRNRVHGYMRTGLSFTAAVERSRVPHENKLTFEIDGVKRTLIEWCRLTGVKYVTANARRARGVPIEEAIEWKGGRR